MSSGIALSVLRNEWRRRAGWMAGVALTIALGGGVAMGAVVIARRTDRAYPDYVAHAAVADVSVNPSISSTALDERIRTLPGVRSVHSSSLLLATISQLTGGPWGELASDDKDAAFQVHGSTDGDHVDADRPAVSAGRLPTGDHEVFIGDDARADVERAAGHQLHLGDSLPMAFWWGGLAAQDEEPSPDQIVSPIGVEQLRVVGFGRLPDEVLPDGLYSRDRLIVSADIAQRYSCSFDVRPDATPEESTFAAIVPADCATQFNYYSLTLAANADLSSIRDAYSAMAGQLDTLLPASIQAQHSYEYIAQTRADLDAAVARTTRPTVAALVVFALVTALATLAVAGLLFTRNLRRDDRDQASLLAIGASNWQRMRISAAAPLVGAAVGLVGATLVALLISPIGPLGVVRDVDPSPGMALPAGVVLASLAVLALVLVTLVAVVATVGARRTATTRQNARSSLWRARLLDRGSRPSMTTGFRATLGQSGSGTTGAVLIGCVIAIAAVMSASIFGTNLSALVTQPHRYGWPWDVGVLTNSGYGFTDPSAVDASLQTSGHGATRTFYGFDPSIQVDGHPMPAIFGLTPDHHLDFPVVEGRAPEAPGEAAIGTSTADHFGISIGDRVSLETPFFEPESVTIVGTAVLPAVGAFIADRTGLGKGIYVVPAAKQTDNNPGISFTGISLPHGTTAAVFLQRLGPQLSSWDSGSGQPMLTLTNAVRPPEIVNISDMRTAPLVLGALLAISLVAGLALATAVSVRDRRRELAILRALGFTRRALYTSVWWHVVSTIAIGLIVGVPLGIVAGRYAWSTFADQLGVVPRADVSVGLVAAVVAGSVVLAALAAALPARRAARVAPGDALRTAS